MRNSLLIVTLFISFFTYSQHLKANNFVFATYENKSKDVKILSYVTIDIKGKMKVFLDDKKNPSYYSYQLTKDEIFKLNKIFSKNFQDFIERKKLDAGEHYAGNRNYASYTYYKVKESLCFIELFMNPEFNEVLNMLQDKIYKQEVSAKISKFETHFELLKNSILIQEEIDNYLPIKELPPPPMK